MTETTLVFQKWSEIEPEVGKYIIGIVNLYGHKEAYWGQVIDDNLLELPLGDMIDTEDLSEWAELDLGDEP